MCVDSLGWKTAESCFDVIELIFAFQKSYKLWWISLRAVNENTITLQTFIMTTFSFSSLCGSNQNSDWSLVAWPFYGNVHCPWIIATVYKGHRIEYAFEAGYIVCSYVG